jgi:hypothetical protein
MALDLSSSLNGALDDGYSAVFKAPKPKEEPVEAPMQLAGPSPTGEPPAAVEDKSGVRAKTEAGITATRAKNEYEEAKRVAAKGETAAKEAREAAVYAEYKPRLTAPYESFKPTGDTASSLASLGLMIGMLGAMGGTKGLTSATGAMNAIAGMMTGYQEGSKEKYNKERQIFEENLKVAQQNHALIEKEFERAVKYAKYDLTGATNAMIKSSLARGDTTTAKSIETRGLMPTASEWSQGTRKILGPLEIAKQKMYAAEEARVRAEGEVEARKAEKPTATSVRVPREIVVDGVKKMVTPDQEQALIAKGIPYTLAPRERAASDAYGFNDIIAVAANEAAGSITNIMNLPEGSTTGAFQGQNTKGLLGAPIGALANTLTTEDVQRYNTEIGNFGRYLAQVTKGGRNVTNADIDKNQAQFAIREGDSPLTVLTRIGQMRQSLERALEVKIASEKTPPALKEIYKTRLAEVQEAIPFTVNDVNKIRNQKDGTKTFTDMIGEAGLGKPTFNSLDELRSAIASGQIDEEAAKKEYQRLKSAGQ